MTQEEMEKLAGMIAARLMDTFAARLDMIEEVVFSEAAENETGTANKSSLIAPALNLDSLKDAIFERCKFPGGKSYPQLNSSSITGMIDNFLKINGDHPEAKKYKDKGFMPAASQLLEKLLCDMERDGRIVKIKSSANCYKYQSLLTVDVF